MHNSRLVILMILQRAREERLSDDGLHQDPPRLCHLPCHGHILQHTCTKSFCIYMMTPQKMQVGCLPHYYNNRHRYSDYNSNYRHYSYVKEPSYSQPAGRWRSTQSLFFTLLSRWVRLVECIGPRTFCTFPVGSREQAKTFPPSYQVDLF